VALIVFNVMPRSQVIYDAPQLIQDNNVYLVTFSVPGPSLLTATATAAEEKLFDFSVWKKADYDAVLLAIDHPTPESWEAAMDAKALHQLERQSAVALADYELPAGEYVVVVANNPEYVNDSITVTMTYALRKK